MDVNQVLTPHKINYDSDLKLLKADECRGKVNVRTYSTEGDNVGSGENIMGNLLIPNSYRDAGDVVIGATEDIETSSVFFFIYNPDPNKDKIIKYTTTTKLVELILKWDLGFDVKVKITGSFVTGGMLFWTFRKFNSFLNNDFNPPRKINIDRAKNFTTAFNGTLKNTVLSCGKADEWPTKHSAFRDVNGDSYTAYMIAGVSRYVSNSWVATWVLEPSGKIFRDATGYGQVFDSFVRAGKYYIVTTRLWGDNHAFFPYSGHILQYSAESYFGINMPVLDVIKAPPLSSPTASYNDDPASKGNKVQGKIFQFRYRYIYDDYEASVWSSISPIPLPTVFETLVGSFLQYNKDNTINVWVDSGSYEVRTIEVAVRDGNTGAWQIYKRIEKYSPEGLILLDSNIYALAVFTNNEVIEGIDPDDASRPFDYVPLVAGRQTVMEKNRLLYGDIDEPVFDAVPIDVSLIHVTEKKSTYTVKTSTNHRTYPTMFWKAPEPGMHCVGHDQRRDFVNYPIVINLDSVDGLSFVSGDMISVDYTYEDDTINYHESHTVTYVSKAGDTFTDVRNGILRAFIELGVHCFIKKHSVDWYPGLDEEQLMIRKCATFPTIGLETELGFWVSWNYETSDKIIWANLSTKVMVNGTMRKYKQFKSSAYHPLGIVYYERGERCGGANTSEESTIYIPNQVESIETNTYDNLILQNQISWQINHRPPMEATHYQWVYAKNASISYFLQTIVLKNGTNVYVSREAISESVSTGVINRVLIDLVTPVLDTSEKLDKFYVRPYEFQQGDRMRFLYIIDDRKNPPQLITTDRYLDIDIIGVDYPTAPTHGSTEWQNMTIILPDFDFEHFCMGLYETVVEIYRPKQASESNLYYEIGQRFEILNPNTVNRCHQGDTTTGWGRDQSANLVTSARGRLRDTGDCYIRPRYLVGHNVFPIEDNSLSDFYSSESCDIGRPNVILRNTRRITYGSGYRNSEKYFQNTMVNGFSTFLANSLNILARQDGSLTGMVESGDVLRMLQVKKCTSILIGKSGLKQATLNGTDIVTTVDSVLGSIVVHPETFGTPFPESMAQSDSFTYFYDIYNLCYCRWANNGVNQIVRKDSRTGYDFGMNKYFRDKSRALLASGIENVKVYATFEKEFENLIVSFVDSVNPLNNETIAFHEPSNSWTMFLTFTPDFFGTSGTVMLSSILGNLYQHNINPVRCNFYGVQYDSEVEVVMNINPKDNKVFTSIEVVSLQSWEAPNTGDILVLTDGLSMQSRLKSTKFTSRENKKIASFGRDMFTHGVEKQEDLVNGRPLRGQALKIRLVNHDTTEAVLFAVNINATISE